MMKRKTLCAMLAILMGGVLLPLGSQSQSVPRVADEAPRRVEQAPERRNAETKPPRGEPRRDEDLYSLAVRVILGSETGIQGTVPKSLRELGDVLSRKFNYAGYEDLNQVQVGIFADEDAIVRILPQHYLRVIPRGKTSDGRGLRVKLELYRAEDEETLRTSLYLPTDADAAARRSVLELKEAGGRDGLILLPVMSTAAVLREEVWQAYGGMEVRTASSLLQTDPSGFFGRKRQAGGPQRYLILGVKLNGEDLR